MSKNNNFLIGIVMIKHLYEEPVFQPYTKAEKVLIYGRILKRLLVDRDREVYLGLCSYMAAAEVFYGFHFTHKLFNADDALEISPFPELLKYRPIHRVTSTGHSNGNFWFPLNKEGHKQRIAIINEILLHGLD